MGLFPYTCPECGGGYHRCGTKHDNDEGDESIECDGGQCCWEDDVVFPMKQVDDTIKYYSGQYSGYGDVDTRRLNKVFSLEFEEYFEDWTHQNIEIVTDRFICKSCFLQTHSENEIMPDNKLTLDELNSDENLINELKLNTWSKFTPLKI